MPAHRDSSTLSNYNVYRIIHTTTNFSINFDERIFSGNVIHRIKAFGAFQEAILLDTDGLDILAVKVNDQEVGWELLPEKKPLGRALKVEIGQSLEKDSSLELDIALKTTAGGKALQFLTPLQAGSDHPYVYSQCQPICARSIFPCQDTPDVKSTFEFNITSSLPVFASGIPLKNSPAAIPNLGQTKTYRFEQKVPIPSYLFAVTSGDLQTAPIGPRSVVATGPKGLKAAQWEFEGSTQAYFDAIEKTIFPYQFGQYNLLVLPPSFAFGGMENPVSLLHLLKRTLRPRVLQRLTQSKVFTYVTPTCVSGDRENIGVIAHELSHSWSGNLVTASSWSDFWLNEGWTTYLERRLQAAVHGEPERDFHAIIGWKSLVDSVESYGEGHEFTKLVPNLVDQDPGDAFSTIPYEKGYTFLSYLESQLGKDKWNEYIPRYFTRFARSSLDSHEFKADLLWNFSNDPDASAVLNAVDWDTWYYSPGLPPKPKFDTSLVDVCYALAAKWENATPERTFEPDYSDISGWKANQVVIFLDSVLSGKALSKEQAHLMGQVYKLIKTSNVEVSARYLKLALRAKDEAAYAPTVDLLSNVGRMKFVRPLYVDVSTLQITSC